MSVECKEPKQWLPSNHGQHTTASRLRMLAGFVDQNDIPDHEIVTASADGWSDADLHLSPGRFRKLVGGEFTVDAHGHARVFMDGVRLCCVLD